MTEKKGGAVRKGHEEGMKMVVSLLEEFELPVGFLPLTDVVEVGFVCATRYMWIVQKKKVEHHFETIKKFLSYDTEITFFIGRKRITMLRGVSYKEFKFVLPIKEIDVVSFIEKIRFKSIFGITITLPLEGFVAENDQIYKTLSIL